jgi:hypothetical protein
MMAPFVLSSAINRAAFGHSEAQDQRLGERQQDEDAWLQRRRH